MFALVRTSTEGKVQREFLLIDMALPGITIKPIVNLEGSHELNQVFFDDVRVPKANRVGAENQMDSCQSVALNGFRCHPLSCVALTRETNIEIDDYTGASNSEIHYKIAV